jgi:hypothetical protein
MDQTFEVQDSPLLSGVASVGFAVVFFVIAAREMADEGSGGGGLVVLGLISSGIAGWGIYRLFYEPFRVTVTEEGVVLRARVGERFISWRELDVVRMRIGQRGGGSMWWRARGKRPVRSPIFGDVGGLFAEIGRRSPATVVS